MAGVLISITKQMDFSGATLTATGDSVKSNFCFAVQIPIFNVTIAVTESKNQVEAKPRWWYGEYLNCASSD
jgi:hypothetical protein